MCIRFGMYGVLKRKVQGPPEENRAFTELQALGCGAACGAISVPISHPIDVVKTNMMGLHHKRCAQQRSASGLTSPDRSVSVCFPSVRFGGIWGCVRIIVQEEGIRGLFKGMGMRLARVTSEQAVCFSVMEKIATMLDAF